MALLKNPFKKEAKKESAAPKVKKERISKKEASRPVRSQKSESVAVSEHKPPKAKKVRRVSGTADVVHAAGIIRTPHITEKAARANEFSQYIFRVSRHATKNDIKRAIERGYGVPVVSVRVVTLPSKKRRLGWSQGTKSGFKKAIVRLEKGAKLEVLPQ